MLFLLNAREFLSFTDSHANLPILKIINLFSECFIVGFMTGAETLWPYGVLCLSTYFRTLNITLTLFRRPTTMIYGFNIVIACLLLLLFFPLCGEGVSKV